MSKGYSPALLPLVLEPFPAPRKSVIVGYGLRETDYSEGLEETSSNPSNQPKSNGRGPCSVELATRSRKLRKIWRILEKENSVAGSVQTLLLRIVAQVREGAQVGQVWG